MAEIKKIMEKDGDGITRQIMPETIPSAIIGLEEFINHANPGQSGVSSVNGQTGSIILTKNDLGIGVASEYREGLMSAELFIKMQEIIGWYDQIGINLGDITAEQVPDEGAGE